MFNREDAGFGKKANDRHKKTPSFHNEGEKITIIHLLVQI